MFRLFYCICKNYSVFSVSYTHLDVYKRQYVGTSELNDVLQEGIMSVLTDAPSNDFETFDLPADKKPYVLLVVGVNGVGKTTTIGKLAHNFKKAGKSVVLGAADTFRAAAVDQLTIWSERCLLNTSRCV